MTRAKPVSPEALRLEAAARRLRLQAEALLDAAAIRRLRLQAGYSTRRFERSALGVSASAVRGLEDGSNHHQLPLTLIARLAELLGVATREVFARAPRDATEPTTDDRIIEAALQSLPGIVAVSDLARALRWKLERARRALDALDRRLQSTGARLHCNGWQQCAIRSATEHLSDEQQQALHRIGPRDRGLNQVTARLLLTATRGELDERWFKTASNSERVALQSVLITVAGQTQIILRRTRSTDSIRTCASGPRSASYARSNAGRKTTRPTPTPPVALLKNSRHLTEETETSALNFS